MYSEFKPLCKTSGMSCGREMKMRLEVPQWHVLDVLIDDDDDVSSDGSNSKLIAKTSFGQSLCNANLINCDLGSIVLNCYPSI